MESWAYLQILRRKWWIVIPIFVITLGATAWFTFAQPPVYQAAATLIARPGPEFSDVRSRVSAQDTLSNRAQIVTTYADVANSRLILGQATKELHLSPQQGKNLSVSSSAIANTSLIQITAQGSDPNLVADFANAIAYETITYVQDAHELYQLEFLDEAAVPSSPISNRMLYLALGMVVALFLSVGAAFLVEPLIVSRERVAGHWRRAALPGFATTKSTRTTKRELPALVERPTHTGETLLAAANTDKESQN